MAKKQSSSTASASKSESTPTTRKSRQSSRGKRAIGLAGFDFQALNQQYINSATPITDASGYGVAIEPAAVATGSTYWKAVGIHHLSPDENRSRHNIFVDVLDEGGQRAKEMLVGWTWEGNNEPSSTNRLDKPDNEPGTDIPIFNSVLRLWVQGNEPSDIVGGIHYKHADERNGAGDIFNSIGHHSFYIVFQRTQKDSNTPVIDDGVTNGHVDPVVVLPPPLVTSGRIRAGEKLGIDANRPINAQTGAIGTTVADPNIIADTGVGWVRLNFVLGERWTSPLDTNRPNGLTWAETYRQIITGLRGRGLRIYGLIGAEAMRDNPGDQFRDPLAGPLSNDWIGHYVETFTQIAELFHRDVEYFESFNEPDDWHGSNRNWVHPDWFALMLQEIHAKVRNHSNPDVRAIRLISGPLQGLHNDDGNNNGNAGARYLRSTLQAGTHLFSWGQNSVPFPFDGVGYHLYVAQSAANSNDDIRRVYRHYVDEVRQVMREEMGHEKPIYLSEFGWQDSVVGEQRQVECMDVGTRLVLQDPAVALGFWFCTQDFAEKFGLYREGALDPDNRKPVYNAFKILCASIVDVPVATSAVMASSTQWTGIVTADELNVRMGPGVEHAKIGSLVENSQVQVSGQIGEWLQIAWSGTPGFVHSNFVVNRDAPRLVRGLDFAARDLTPPPGADATTRAVANTWNRYRELIEREAARLGIDSGIAVAVLVAESSGAAFGPNGRMIIRFENHIFHNLWGEHNQTRFAQHFALDPTARWKGHQWRPDTASAWQPCHTNQSMEWLVFDFARRLDNSAAMMSISMGAPQIMGFNHRSIGYASVQEMFNAFQNSDTVQVGSLFRFMEVNGLVTAVQQGDLRRFAAAYNGPGQADLYADIIQRNLAAFHTLAGDGSRALIAVPATRTTSQSPITDDAELATAWRAQLRFGLSTSKSLLETMLKDIGAAHLDDGIRMAQLGIIMNSYWAQLALVSDASSVKNAGEGAVTQLDVLLGHQIAETTKTNRDEVGTLQPPVQVGTGRGGRKRALCIGIDEYAQQPLSGCVADAQMWAEALVSLGFEEPSLLLNQAATRDAIVTAVQDLVASSQSGDVVVIQYAGHGTQLSDVSGDEVGGDTPDQDEALVPFDFLSGAYVIDDDLGAIFTNIPAGVNVTCFMDCCHSGSISRMIVGPDERPRFMVADAAMLEAHRHYRQSLGSRRAPGKRDIESMREVVFSACQSSEVAWESAGHGEFTLRASTLLKGNTGSLNHEAFMEQITAAFGPSPRQNPLMECATVVRGRTLLEALTV